MVIIIYPLSPRLYQRLKYYVRATFFNLQIKFYWIGNTIPERSLIKKKGWTPKEKKKVIRNHASNLKECAPVNGGNADSQLSSAIYGVVANEFMRLQCFGSKPSYRVSFNLAVKYGSPFWKLSTRYRYGVPCIYWLVCWNRILLKRIFIVKRSAVSFAIVCPRPLSVCSLFFPVLSLTVPILIISFHAWFMFLGSRILVLLFDVVK